MSADILNAVHAAGVELAIGETGNLKVTGDRVEIERWLPEIRAHKPELLALLRQPQAPNGLADAFERALIQAAEHGKSLRLADGKLEFIDHPGTQVEPGPELHPDDLAIAQAYLRHIGETDDSLIREYLDGLARDHGRLRLLYAEAVRIGIATYDPEPEAIATPATGAVCARCRHWTPNPINPTGGLGRCRANAPASRRAGSCWPWPDADVRCQFEPTPSALEAETPTVSPTP